jgi:glycosyltransferase involved in cell wall biosynthesis
MRTRGQPPHLIHAHVFSAGFEALLVSSGRVPVVVSEHHTDFVEDLVNGRDATIARLVYRHAALVCPVSYRLRASLERLQPRGRYEVVPNVVDTTAFTGALHSPREALSRLIVVARLDRQKGIEYLLQALQLARAAGADFTLDVIGGGPLRADLERLARDAGIAQLVTFHGPRPREEIVHLMARSDVLVLPSIVETFGIVLIEALAAGLPIITTTAVPDHDRLRRGFGIVVPPRDAAALRDAILEMRLNGWAFPQRAAAEIARSYSAEVIANRWEEIYREVTDGTAA